MGKLRFEPKRKKPGFQSYGLGVGDLEDLVSPKVRRYSIETIQGTRIELEGLSDFHQIASLVRLLEEGPWDELG